MLQPPPRLPALALGASPRAPAAPLARFFSGSPESLWAQIEAAQPALVADAQRLFEQITTTRQSALRSASLADDHAPDRRAQHDKVWAVVAVVATAVARDLADERQRLAANGSSFARSNGKARSTTTKTRRTVGRKRKMRQQDDSEEDEDDEEEEDEEDNDTASSAEEENARASRSGGNGHDVTARPQWHLVDFLVEANVSMNTFLENLTSLFDRLLLDPELLEVTTQLKEEFTVATVLFEKYRFMWKKFALREQRNNVPPERTELLQRIGWLLFLTAHRRLTAVYTGLGSLYYLLLGVLKLVISQVAPRSVEAEVAAALSALGGPLAKASAGANRGLDDQSLLDMLCSAPRVDPEEVTKAYDNVVALVVSLARDETLVVASGDAADHANEQDTAATLRDAFAQPTLRQNSMRLFELYARTNLRTYGSFDERVYLNEQSRQSLLGPRPQGVTGGGNHENSNGDTHGMPPLASRPDRPSTNPLTSPVHRPMTPSRQEASTPSGAPPPPSPFTVQAWQWHGSSPPPSLPRGLNTPISRTLGGVQKSPFVMQTPVTAAVEISSWIRDTMASLTADGSPTYVSPKLQGFFTDCTTDPTDHIADLLSEMSHKLLTNRRRNGSGSGGRADSGRANGSEFSEVDGSLRKTTNLSVALFYRVLEALLISERARLRTSNFSSLLNNETFICSLFACSLEVGLKSHSLITLSFPFLLDNVGVNAFDFGKVIESFVKHVPRLPGTLKRHMRDLEQMILDSLAWRADSRLYVVLKGEPQQQPTPVPSPGPSESGSTSTDASSAPPAPAPTSSTAPRATVLQLFFRKVLSLAATRIFRLGSMLELDAAHMNQVWSAIKECMSSQVHLLKDRHLDQIILCSIYGVCKVNKLSTVTFNKIIEQYKKLQTPQWAVHGSNGPAQTAAHAAFASASLTRKSSDIIRDIKLDDENTRGDVIKFYNRCYIPAMKVFLLQYQAQDKQVAAANAAITSATGSRDHLVTPSTSDSDIVAEAAASAVEKVMQSHAPPRTPVRGRPVRPTTSSPAMFGSPSRNLPMFTTAEVESLPVSVHQTSPKRVLASNIYMSPLQNARYQQQRSHMTPRSHALYAFGESPSRDLALINRAVNSSVVGSVRTAAAPPPLAVAGDHSDAHEDATSGSNSSHTTPTSKRRRT